MSANSQWTLDLLYTRSQFAKPGLKKLIKSVSARAQRRGAKRQLAQETVVAESDLRQMSADELESYADQFLASHQESPVDDDESFIREIHAHATDDDAGLPSHLLGALPDWMLNRLEAARGDAFELLSLFEAKSVSPKAAISNEDEALYA